MTFLVGFSAMAQCGICSGFGYVIRKETCQSCQGKGSFIKYVQKNCSSCQGRGYTVKTCSSCHSSGYLTNSKTCSTCGGRGYHIIDKGECSRCKGQGRISINQYLSQDCPSCEGGRVKIQKICSVCHGNRVIQEKMKCSVCRGQGHIKQACYTCNSTGKNSERHRQICNVCKGRGEIARRIVCPTCNGVGNK